MMSTHHRSATHSQVVPRTGWYQVPTPVAGTEKSPMARAHPGPVHNPLHSLVPVNVLHIYATVSGVASETLHFHGIGGYWGSCQNVSLVRCDTDYPRSPRAEPLAVDTSLTLLLCEMSDATMRCLGRRTDSRRRSIRTPRVVRSHNVCFAQFRSI